MHDLVHDLAMSVLGDEIPHASKQGNTGESIIHFELLDDSTKSLQTFTQYPTNIRGLRLLESDKTVCHGGASSSSAEFLSIRVCGRIGIDDHDDVLSSIKDIHVLDLSGCSIRKLPYSIGSLKLLRYLNAPRVQWWDIPYCVTKLSKLTYLSLRGSSTLLALPDSIGEMEGLMYLDLSGCSLIEKLPVSFGKLTKLVHLDLSNCSTLTYVSEYLKSLTNLEYLDLSHCGNIGELSKKLGTLLKLRYLNISHSSYVCSHDYSWPNAEVLSTLTKLECLNLSSLTPPGLSGLQREHWLGREGPIAFQNLKNLVYLDLSQCSGVHGVLDTLGSLTKLQHLNLSGCVCFDNCTELHLTSMLEAIGNLTELHYLSLSACCTLTGPLQDQAFFVFLECIGNLLNLEHLDLSYNDSLTSLPECFCNLRKLHTLDLSGSNLRDLPSFLNEMDRLKFLELKDCLYLKMSKHEQLNKNLAVLPYFVVHTDSHDSGINLFLINDVNRTDLVISRLENVKSVQEVRSIKLARKDRMEILNLNWTEDVERFVDDMEVLGELVPPTTLKHLRIYGYNSARFPGWFVGSIAFHLPNLVGISMSDFPKCNSLPPLGQLPNLERLNLERMNGISEINWDLCGSRRAFPRLEYFTLREMESLNCLPPLGLLPKLKCLHLERMNGISEINWDLCGSRRAFPRLESFTLSDMENVKVWYTAYPGGRDGVSEFMFPKLSSLKISDCPDLRLKPCPHRVYSWIIKGRSDAVISGEGEGASQISVSYFPSVLVTDLTVSGCKVPMHQWRLLHHLPGLTELSIAECSDLSSSPEIIRALSSLREMELRSPGELELPNWLGQLAPLEDLTVECRRVKVPQDGFPNLTRLRSLGLSAFESMTTLQQLVGSLVSLQQLQIRGCKNLNDLAESFGRLSSLKGLDISYCDTITSLPESIGCLTSLNSLCIQCIGKDVMRLL